MIMMKTILMSNNRGVETIINPSLNHLNILLRTLHNTNNKLCQWRMQFYNSPMVIITIIITLISILVEVGVSYQFHKIINHLEFWNQTRILQMEILIILVAVNYHNLKCPKHPLLTIINYLNKIKIDHLY